MAGFQLNCQILKVRDFHWVGIKNRAYSSHTSVMSKHHREGGIWGKMAEILKADRSKSVCECLWRGQGRREQREGKGEWGGEEIWVGMVTPRAEKANRTPHPAHLLEMATVRALCPHTGTVPKPRTGRAVGRAAPASPLSSCRGRI